MHKWRSTCTCWESNQTYGKSHLIAFQHVSATSKPRELSRRSRCEAPAVFRSPASSLCSFVDAGPASIYPGGKDEIHQDPALPALFLPYSSLNHQSNIVRWVLSSCPLLSLDPHRLWKPASPGVHAGGTLTWVPKTLACKNLSTKGKLLEQKQIRLITIALEKPHLEMVVRWLESFG